MLSINIYGEREELSPLKVISRASYWPVRNGETSVDCSLQRSKHLVPCCGSGQTCIQVTCEGTWLSVNVFHAEFTSRHLHLALVHLVHAKLVQQLRGWQDFNIYFYINTNNDTLAWPFIKCIDVRNHEALSASGCSYPACQQQPCAVSSSIVGKADCDPIFGQFVRVSGTHNMVSFNLCIGNLQETDCWVWTYSTCCNTSLGQFLTPWPGSRCPGWKTWRSFGTWACCTCSCPAGPGAFGHNSQFCPLWSEKLPSDCWNNSITYGTIYIYIWHDRYGPWAISGCTVWKASVQNIFLPLLLLNLTSYLLK